MPLWSCTLCPSRKQGPERPRANATVRFCLHCSAKSDTLVPRVCEALEKRRAKREETKKAAQLRRKAAQKRAQERAVQKKAELAEQRCWWLGTDLRVLWAQMLALPFAVAELEGTKTPEMKIRWCSREPASRWGVAFWWRQQIQVSIWKGLELPHLTDTMLHELAHLIAVARYGRNDGQGHQHSFKRTYTTLIHEWKSHHPEVDVRVDARWYLNPGTP